MSKYSTSKICSEDMGDKLICPDCGNTNVETSNEDYSFTYGTGSDAVQLSARVAVMHCIDCDFSFLGSDSEEACHEVICQHLGVMTPHQVKALRKFYKYSQAQFSSVSKIGAATLSRWERGTLVQGLAYDNYLYLLGFTDNIDRLNNRNNAQTPGPLPAFKAEKPSFRKLVLTKELLDREAKFKLCAC